MRILIVTCPHPDFRGEPNVGVVEINQSISFPSIKTKTLQEAHEELGRALWKEIHEKTDPTPSWFADWLSRVPKGGRCGGCYKWAIGWVGLPGNEPDYDNWFAWSVRFHNSVNAKIDAEGKPREQWSIERAMEYYVR